MRRGSVAALALALVWSIAWVPAERTPVSPGRTGTALVRGETGTVVRAVLEDGAGNRSESADIHLQPWWQTVGVTGVDLGEGTELTVEPVSDVGSVEVRDVAVAPLSPTRAWREGRRIYVDGERFSILGYTYVATPPGGFPNATHWWANPAQCQSDAQLMRAAGVTALRIYWIETSHADEPVRQCADAFHAAGVKLLWYVQPAGGFATGSQHYQNVDGWAQLAWPALEAAIDALAHHPATIGWVIGNEVGYPSTNEGYFEGLEFLARRAKAKDPHHLTTTSLVHGQYFKYVKPGIVPHLDLWGINSYAKPGTFADRWKPIVHRDPERPAFISEFGVERYRCALPDGMPTYAGAYYAYAGCLADGSGEDQALQANWERGNWEEVVAEAAQDEPTVVGGVMLGWTDLWWFNLVFAGSGTPLEHDVGGQQGRYCDPENGVCGFWNEQFPDGHASHEWFGKTHAMPLTEPGPRVTTLALDAAAELFTGRRRPAITAQSVDVGEGCVVTVRLRTDHPTFARVDAGRQVLTFEREFVSTDSTVIDRDVTSTDRGTRHRLDLTLEQPGRYRVFPRVFDDDGRFTTGRPVTVTC